MHLNEILNYFNDIKKIGNNSYQCKCPSHDDKKASLTITEDNNKILMHCHAGCELEYILKSIGMKEKDLFNNLVLIPIDQRYNIITMKKLINIIINFEKSDKL